MCSTDWCATRFPSQGGCQEGVGAGGGHGEEDADPRAQGARSLNTQADTVIFGLVQKVPDL